MCSAQPASNVNLQKENLSRTAYVSYIELKYYQDRVPLKHLTNDVFLIFDLKGKRTNQSKVKVMFLMSYHVKQEMGKRKPETLSFTLLLF